MNSSHRSSDNLTPASTQRKSKVNFQQSQQQADAISTDPDDDQTVQTKRSAISRYNKQRIAEKYGVLSIDIEQDEEEEKKDVEEDDELQLIDKSSRYAKAYYLGHQIWVALLAILLVVEFGLSVFAAIYLIFFNESGPPFYSNVYFWALVVVSPSLTIAHVRLIANESNGLEAKSLKSAKRASIKLLLVLCGFLILIIYKIFFNSSLYNM